MNKRLRLVRTKASIDPAEFAAVVRRGLTSVPKSLPCRYFYDEEGSRLFEEICELPEYYLTRAEREILLARAGEIVSLIETPLILAELGSGSAVKTRLLIEEILRHQRKLKFVPVDISHSILEASSLELLGHHANLEIMGLAGEYEEGLRVLAQETSRPKLILWLGSNVGNLTRSEAAVFLGRVRGVLAPGDRFLLGVDLRKEARVLEDAYDDPSGVTAQFNLNLLSRINRELGGRFDLSQYRHRAIYKETDGRVEMYLVSQVAQKVAIDRLGIEVEFAAQEPIHTEDSYKYSLTEIDALASASGLRIVRQWLDSKGRFSLSLLSGAVDSGPQGYPVDLDRQPPSAV